MCKTLNIIIGMETVIFFRAMLISVVLGLLKMVESNSDLSWQLSDGFARHRLNQQLDSALVKIVSHLNSTVYLSVLSDMCYKVILVVSTVL